MLLTKLNPKTSSHAMIEYGTTIQGIRTILDWTDVAARLGGLPEVSILIARALIQGDERSRGILRDWLRGATIRISHEEGWDIGFDKKEALAAFCWLQIWPDRCPTCKGRGTSPDPGNPHILGPCIQCDGLKYLKPSTEYRAKVYEVSRRTFYYKWREREIKILNRFKYFEDILSERFPEIKGACK